MKKMLWKLLKSFYLNLKDIWYEKRVVDWRNESMKNINCLGCNKCHHYDV